LGVGLTTLPCKKKIVEKPPRNSAGFFGGGQGLRWAVKPRKEERRILETYIQMFSKIKRHSFLSFLVFCAEFHISCLHRNEAIGPLMRGFVCHMQMI
jgi:hypothetical protein